jgi:hypothetical protein
MPPKLWNRGVRAALGAAVATTALALFAVAPALASNHLVKIREVYAGSSAFPADEYVEVQLYASGENFFENQIHLRLYNADGTVSSAFSPGTMDGNPPNGDSQRRVLFATQTAQTRFGVSAGYTLAPGSHIADAGGAVCYVSGTPGFVDCVSWGDFSNTSGTPLPSPTGGNVDPSGISDGSDSSPAAAIRRSIARGCGTLLEASDDTNKPADWSDVTPDPLNNAATPPEKTCPATTITKHPKRKTTDRTPTFKFRSSQGGSSFECKLDKGEFKSCASPFTTRRLKRGKHVFSVRATKAGSTDPTPARSSFKVVKKHHHHHH